MKSGERKAKRNGIYDTMEHEPDSRAAERFRRPAMVHGKLTALAAAEIVKRDIECLSDDRRAQLIEMAEECLHSGR